MTVTLARHMAESSCCRHAVVTNGKIEVIVSSGTGLSQVQRSLEMYADSYSPKLLRTREHYDRLALLGDAEGNG